MSIRFWMWICPLKIRYKFFMNLGWRKTITDWVRKTSCLDCTLQLDEQFHTFAISWILVDHPWKLFWYSIGEPGDTSICWRWWRSKRWLVSLSVGFGDSFSQINLSTIIWSFVVLMDHSHIINGLFWPEDECVTSTDIEGRFHIDGQFHAFRKHMISKKLCWNISFLGRFEDILSVHQNDRSWSNP